MAKKKPGSTSTRVVGKHAGRNAGDTVKFKVAKGGKEFPVKIVKDRGTKNTSRIGKLSRAKKR